MNILDKITAYKREDIRARKVLNPAGNLERSDFFKQKMPSFLEALVKEEPSIIAEFKRKSPSRGEINLFADIEKVSAGYEAAGAAAMSVLTDEEFFGGNDADLLKAAGLIKIPLLRKDFIVDEYQVIESKSLGASAILLIASVLSKREIQVFSGIALSLGMDILYEIHDRTDLDKINQDIRIIGVNNRNLKTFEISMDNTIDLLRYLPHDCLKVAESGFQTDKDVRQLYDAGYDAFLIGGYFMGSDNPGLTASAFINGLKSGTE